MFKLIFLIYILFNCNVAQAPADKIHVRYNQTFSFDQNTFEAMGISNVKGLIGMIKLRLSTSIENVFEKVINIRRGENEVLGLETLISELYNTEDDALGVVIGGKHNYTEYPLFSFLFCCNII